MFGGSVQRGVRPILIIQNNIGNKYSPVLTVIPFTSKRKKYMPTHVQIKGFGLEEESILLAEQILTIPKNTLVKKIGNLNTSILKKKVYDAINVQIGR